ncbi:hypothetical protein [Paenibacillus lentus]|uniref:Lipoprotein n=1 Tax=Paenibacillus lentus TaxID=1338368 RepID=A0A3S8RQK6_9BACL|nr:hypothetical protein [Paenibacillus lentus]AZK45129.1 hypothetical protein EIM92_02075 [Paenibacillus lentus]
MTRFMMLFIAIGLVLVGCSQDQIKGNNPKEAPVVSGDSSADRALNTEVARSAEQKLLPEYVAKNESGLSDQDFETAYEMCVKALSDYYKAVWNGSDIEMDTLIENDHLKQYTQQKIQSQYDVHIKHNLTDDLVQDIEIGAWEVEYKDDVNGGYLYFNLPVQINMTVGGYGEVTEFLVRNVNGKLVIVDWYTGAKDSYDFMVRGANLTINNPDIWNDSEWVKKLDHMTDEF